VLEYKDNEIVDGELSEDELEEPKKVMSLER